MVSQAPFAAAITKAFAVKARVTAVLASLSYGQNLLEAS